MPATDKTPGFDAVSALRGVGLRPTRQRVALVRLIAEGGDRHLSAEELHGEAHEAGIRVSVATVAGEAVSFAELPAAPDGRRIARVDVIVRLSRTGQN